MIRFPDFVRKQACHRPDVNALHFEGRDYTWKDFNDRLHRIAKGLRGLGVRKGDRVAYLGQNSHWMVELYFAPCMIGAVFVPVNFRLSEDEQAEILDDCTPEVLVVDRHYAEAGARLMERSSSLRHLIHADWTTRTGAAANDTLNYEEMIAGMATPSEQDLDDVASSSTETMALFYTSGTTGRPKGAMLSHQGLMINAMGTGNVMEFSPADSFLIMGPLFHLGTGARIYTAAVHGMSMIVQSRFEVVEMARMIERHRVTTTTMVPTMLRMILDHPEFSSFDFSSLRLLTYGSAPMPLALMERALDQIPGVTFCQSYGMTEASPVLSMLTPSDHVDRTDKLASVGAPVHYCDLRIVDEEGHSLPTGQRGEIEIRGPQMMNGYWQQPEETANAFRAGFYRTGDAGYLDEDGYLWLAGRTKEMIISGGENVYPIEAENCLSKHPAVAQVAVIGMPHEKWGETVHAVVSLKEGAHVVADELIAFCRERIAHYKAPRGVTILPGSLPLTTTNKVDKTALRASLLPD